MSRLADVGYSPLDSYAGNVLGNEGWKGKNPTSIIWMFPFLSSICNKEKQSICFTFSQYIQVGFHSKQMQQNIIHPQKTEPL